MRLRRWRNPERRRLGGVLGAALLLVLGLVLSAGPATAVVQAGEATPTPGVTPTPLPEGPIYVVQPGDTLAGIAYRFGIATDALAQANGITDPNLLRPGQRLVLPGFPGVSGALTTVTVGYGETLESLSRRYGVPLTTLQRLNRLVTSDQVVVGQPLAIPASAAENPPPDRLMLRPGEPLQGAAARRGINPWLVVLANDLPGTWAALPNAVLNFPAAEKAAQGPGALPPEVVAVNLKPEAWVQGRTGVFWVQLRLGVRATLGGEWQGHPLHFFLYDKAKNLWVALQGTHALADLGPHPLTLTLTFPDGRKVRFVQPMVIRSGNYGWEKLVVPAALLDPHLSRAEEERLRQLTAKATATRYWDGPFQAPSPYADCFTSRFGTRRDYNEGTYFGYHGGLDFCGGTGTPITAPADGVVVFTGHLDIRGNTTIIDHGWGVYTLYAHQQKIVVREGQRVRAGETIGYVGATGRVTGAHLHWEVRVGGVPVDPQEWLERAFP